MSDTGEIDSMSGGIDPFITVTQANLLIEYLTEYVNRVKDNDTVEYLNDKFHKRRAIQQEQEEREILETLVMGFIRLAERQIWAQGLSNWR